MKVKGVANPRILRIDLIDYLFIPRIACGVSPWSF
jgi:hypothetical protein